MDKPGEHYEKLRTHFASAHLERRPDGSALVLIPDFALKPGWNKQQTTVVFIVPVGYPVAQPDTFWTDPDLRLANGGMPANSGINANYGGPSPRLWFSFHPSSWNPNLDDFLTYVKLIGRRLSEAR